MKFRKPYHLPSILFILLVGGLAGCNKSGKSNSDGLARLKTIPLKRDLHISAQNDSLLIGGFFGVAVDRKGNIYSGDYQQDKIWEFDSNGHFIDTLGGKGKGPGQFERIGGLVIRGDTLYALDNANLRINRYLAERDSILNAVSIPQTKTKGYPRYFFVSRTGDIFVMYEAFSFKGSSGIVHSNDVVMQIWSVGKPEKKVWFTRTGGENYRIKELYVVMFTPILPDNPLTMSPQGAFYGGLADSLRIYTYGSGGAKKPVVKTGLTGEKLTAAQMDSVIKRRGARMGKYLKAMTPPERWPAFDQLVIDDQGNFWVGLTAPFEKQRTWQVFNSKGETLGKTILPADFRLVLVKNHYAYGITQDATGVTSIDRYTISNWYDE